MGILRDFEKRLEGAVEGFFARAFRSGLQPVELAKALQRYAASYQQVGLDGVFVPNVYRFDLSLEDMERFSGFADSLRRELADVVRRTAEERQWSLQGPVQIDLQRNPNVRVGTYELRGKVEAAPKPEAPGGAPVAPRGAALATSPVAGRPTAPVSTTAWLEVASPNGRGQRFALRGEATVGRLPECDVALTDPSVSRRHARLVADGERWTVEDLGSTNGVRLNGHPVAHSVLRDGDRLEFGGVRATFSLEA